MTWTKSDIQKARKVHLAPLLAKRGYSLRKLEYDNYLVESHKDNRFLQFERLKIKHNYWLNQLDRTSGNAIDFFVTFEHKSFHEAMSILVGKSISSPPKS